jgi:tripartite-type tricarboxylate transporter receptor subunit TctC
VIGLAGGRRSYHNDGAMNLRIICHFAFIAVLGAIGFVCPATSQEEWPTRPVLVVSPFTAGSANDIVARLIFDQVGQQLGQAFVVENRPGGGGIVGVASVVRAEPDGYTLLLSSAS